MPRVMARAERGPDADLGGFDAVSFWARGGIGHILTPADGPMIMQRGAMGDAPSGAMLAGGVAAALYQRERTGKGSVVDVALLNTAVWQLGVDLTATTVLREEPRKLHGSSPLPNPLVGPYTTADARYLLLNMLDDTRHWAPTCAALGLDELVDDARFADTAGRAANRAELHDRFAERIGSLPLAELKMRLDAEDTIYSALASPLEVVDDPQVVANGYLAPHPDHPRARLACAPMQYDDEMVAIRRGAPALGEHTAEVLSDLGYTPDELDALRGIHAIA